VPAPAGLENPNSCRSRLLYSGFCTPMDQTCSTIGAVINKRINREIYLECKLLKIYDIFRLEICSFVYKISPQFNSLKTITRQYLKFIDACMACRITCPRNIGVDSWGDGGLCLGHHLFVKLPRPGDSEVTFESSCHLLLPV